MLLAGQMGHFISDQRNRWELIREKEAYRVTVDSISPITDHVYTELDHQSPNEDAVFVKSLECIGNAIPGRHFVSIAIGSKSDAYSRRTFYSWPSVPERTTGFVLPRSWERDLRDGTPILRNRAELGSPEATSYAASLPSIAEEILLAPIRCRAEFGLIEIGNCGPSLFPSHASSIVGLLGRQLAVYHDLLMTIGELTRAKAVLNQKVDAEAQSARNQAQAFMDLEHQIRAPLRHAAGRIPLVLRTAAAIGNPTVTKQLLYLRGILRRATKVAGNTRLFSRLASGLPIEISPVLWTYDDIRLLLIEAAMDNYLIADEKQGLTFGVDEDSFGKLPRGGRVRLDKDLLDQAVNDLLDNAAKYSDPNTHVKIEVNLTKAYFVVSVTNTGLKITPDQVPVIKQRGERGAVARLVVGEGSGIGLWIVDAIMAVHGGVLDIQPSTVDRYTRIRLMFPIGQRG
jgi:signal transduction histidine kinase